MNISKFITSLVIVYSVAFLGSIFTAPSISGWYAQLNKPFFNPPDWIFGPVWTILYFLMGISFYIIWNKKIESKNKNRAVKTFIFQLIMNLLWSLIFFGLHMPLLAFVSIIALWIAILMTMQAFHKISKTAYRLLVPYIIWVSFASILNFAVVLLNR